MVWGTPQGFTGALPLPRYSVLQKAKPGWSTKDILKAGVSMERELPKTRVASKQILGNCRFSKFYRFRYNMMETADLLDLYNYMMILRSRSSNVSWKHPQLTTAFYDCLPSCTPKLWKCRTSMTVCLHMEADADGLHLPSRLVVLGLNRPL